jgi:hypothetical protein
MTTEAGMSPTINRKREACHGYRFLTGLNGLIFSREVIFFGFFAPRSQVQLVNEEEAK